MSVAWHGMDVDDEMHKASIMSMEELRLMQLKIFKERLALYLSTDK